MSKFEKCAIAGHLKSRKSYLKLGNGYLKAMNSYVKSAGVYINTMAKGGGGNGAGEKMKNEAVS